MAGLSLSEMAQLLCWWVNKTSSAFALCFLSVKGTWYVLPWFCPHSNLVRWESNTIPILQRKKTEAKWGVTCLRPPSKNSWQRQDLNRVQSLSHYTTPKTCYPRKSFVHFSEAEKLPTCFSTSCLFLLSSSNLTFHWLSSPSSFSMFLLRDNLSLKEITTQKARPQYPTLFFCKALNLFHPTEVMWLNRMWGHRQHSLPLLEKHFLRFIQPQFQGGDFGGILLDDRDILPEQTVPLLAGERWADTDWAPLVPAIWPFLFVSQDILHQLKLLQWLWIMWETEERSQMTQMWKNRASRHQIQSKVS